MSASSRNRPCVTPETTIGTVIRSVLIEHPEGPKLIVGPKVKSWIRSRKGAAPGFFSKNSKFLPRYGYLPNLWSVKFSGGVY